MKIAVVGSRGLFIGNDELNDYLCEADEIISGGASGVDSCAADYADDHKIKLTVFLPEYNIYGRAAPIVRNKKIVDQADLVIAFWDGISKGTLSVIEYAKKKNKEYKIVLKK